jgi:tetratricopeptide (TPR) repeat protein
MNNFTNKIKSIFFVVFLLSLCQQTIGENNECIDSLLQRASLLRNDTQRVEVLNSIARKYIYITDAKLALKFAQQALVLSKELGWKKGEASALDVIGHVSFYGDEQLPKASEYYHDAMKIREDINDSIGLSISYNNLGNLKLIQLDLDAAEKYYSQNLNLTREVDAPNVVKSYGNLGEVFMKRGLYDLAIAYTDSSINCTDSANYPINLSNDFLRKGNVYNFLGDTDSTIFYFKKALSLREKICDTIGMIYINNIIVQYLIKRNEIVKSDSIIIKNDLLLLCRNTIVNKSLNLENKIHICEIKGDYKTGFEYLKEMLVLKDSILPMNSLKKISEVEFSYILHKKQQINEYKHLQRKRIFIYSILSLSLIIVLIFSLYFLQKNHIKAARLERENLKLQKYKLESDIELGQKELFTNTMRLVEKNETINDVIEKLTKASSRFSVENRKLVLSIITELKRNTAGNFWETFEYSFLRIHKEFYANLEACHSGLSPAEKRLSAFLKLKLNTKDIAYLTHNSIGSVETSRIRLRKKLGLVDKSLNLSNYISQF